MIKPDIDRHLLFIHQPCKLRVFMIHMRTYINPNSRYLLVHGISESRLFENLYQKCRLVNIYYSFMQCCIHAKQVVPLMPLVTIHRRPINRTKSIKRTVNSDLNKVVLKHSHRILIFISENDAIEVNFSSTRNFTKCRILLLQCLVIKCSIGFDSCIREKSVNRFFRNLLNNQLINEIWSPKINIFAIFGAKRRYVEISWSCVAIDWRRSKTEWSADLAASPWSL